jgi:hypothetical protein
VIITELTDFAAPSLKRIANPFYGLADGFFRCRAFDGEGVGGCAGLGFLYAWHIPDGTDYGSLAMAAMHILDPVNCNVRV